jgi:hypothetical protein
VLEDIVIVVDEHCNAAIIKILKNMRISGYQSSVPWLGLGFLTSLSCPSLLARLVVFAYACVPCAGILPVSYGCACAP